MQLSALSGLSKTAATLALAGFVVGFTFLETSTINGVSTCRFVDYGALFLGAAAAGIGTLGAVAALRLAGGGALNLTVSGGAVLVGAFHVLRGIGVVGGPC